MSRFRTLALAAMVILLVGGAAYLFWNPSAVKSPKKAVAPQPSPVQPQTVHLSRAKQAAMHLATDPVQQRQLQPERWIPAQVGYDQTKHIEIIAPTDGVLRELLVRTGQAVGEGKVVALVDSPEIGTYRADVLQRETTAKLVIRERDKARAVQDSLAKLLAQLDDSVDIAALHQSFSNQPLGEFREPLFAAYSKLQMTEQLLAKLRPLADQGIASGRSFIEQQSAREVAIAAYRAARENAEFQSEQQLLRAEDAAADALRRLSIARERLASITGMSAAATDVDNPLSHWSVRAPISGTVEELKLAVGERLPQGQGLMIIADTRSLWVEAELRERDWGAMQVQQGSMVQVECPAVPGRQWTGEVLYVGRTQLAETRAIPVVVRVANDDGKLRPGMFARVSLAVGAMQSALTVPAAAVMENNREQFVFVEHAPGEFEQVRVKTGIAAGDLVALEQGPAAGAKVVTQGAFFLKSELLLEPEE